MLALTRKDVIGCVATGMTAGFLTWLISFFVRDQGHFGILYLILLLVGVPLCWLAGVAVSHQLGRRWAFFSQFGRFVAIGLTNAAVDFGLFNALFALTGRKPELFIWMNVISFVFAIAHSYLWNKYWTFEAHGSHDPTRELLSFIFVNVVAITFNASVGYITFYELVERVGFSVTIAANIGKVAGALIGLIFNFLGFRFVVFKKRHEPFDDPYVV